MKGETLDGQKKHPDRAYVTGKDFTLIPKEDEEVV